MIYAFTDEKVLRLSIRKGQSLGNTNSNFNCQKLILKMEAQSFLYVFKQSLLNNPLKQKLLCFTILFLKNKVTVYYKLFYFTLLRQQTT